MSSRQIDPKKEPRSDLSRRRFLGQLALAGAGAAGLTRLSSAIAEARPAVGIPATEDAVWAGWDSLGRPPGETPGGRASRPGARVMDFETLRGRISPPGRPAVALNAYGGVEVFVPQDGISIWRRWQKDAGGGWQPWEQLAPGAELRTDKNLAVGVNADRRLELFVVNGNASNALWHLWQETPGGDWAPKWESLPGVACNSDPVVVSNLDGRMEVFAREGASVRHIWQTVPSDGWSSVWGDLGGPVEGNLAAARNLDGRLEILASSLTRAPLSRWQTAANNGWSRAFTPHFEPVSFTRDLSLAANQDGRLEMFAIDGSGLHILHHQWQRAPGSSFWDGGGHLAYAQLNVPILGDPPNAGVAFASNLAVALDVDGRLEVFARHMDGRLVSIRQAYPNVQSDQPVAWFGWQNLGGQLDGDPAVVFNQDKRLEVFAKGQNGELWHRKQITPGQW